MSHETRPGGLPIISVITVCFNEPPEKIRDTFSSITSQTCQDFEWIVVDGGSGDETLAAIRKYGERINCLISEPDDGIYAAMNKGIKHATGQFINFMNVGDRYYSDSTLAEVISAIDACPEHDCYYGDVVRVNAEVCVKGLYRQMPNVNVVNLYKRTVCHQAIFALRKLYEKVGDFDLRYRIVADKDWIIRTLKVDARWLYTGIVVCEYDMGGVSSNINARLVEERKLLLCYYGRWERIVLFVRWKATRAVAHLRSCCGVCRGVIGE